MEMREAIARAIAGAYDDDPILRREDWDAADAVLPIIRAAVSALDDVIGEPGCLDRDEVEGLFA